VSGGPTLQELRATAEARGVAPTDADLEQVQAYLAALVPAFAELEELVRTVPEASPPAP
jgi:hypothetical protein